MRKLFILCAALLCLSCSASAQDVPRLSVLPGSPAGRPASPASLLHQTANHGNLALDFNTKNSTFWGNPSMISDTGRMRYFSNWFG